MPTRHEVQQGDCLSSIAAQYGLSWEKIWNDGQNADLKTRRVDPNVLFPGDVVMVPDQVVKEQACATDQHHVFKTTRKPTHVKIRLTLDDQPRTSLPYELQVAGQTITGATDGGGYLEADIPADVHAGVLILGDQEPRERYELSFGALDPVDTDDGVKKRLRSLGFDDTDLASAVRGFQVAQRLQPTGTVDDALRQKLKAMFGQ
jgi:N-acetylmuramoyl-L-alanine amidase